MPFQRTILILLILTRLLLVDTIAQDSLNIETDSNIKYEFSYALSIGGESKLALLLPKINFARKHVLAKSSLYYGAGTGVHVHFLGGWGTLNSFVGLEFNRLDLESSYSYVWFSKIEYPDKPTMEPSNQNLVNFKIGYKFNNAKIRFVTSYVLSETIPDGKERNPLLDVGRINDNLILGLEFTSLIK